MTAAQAYEAACARLDGRPAPVAAPAPVEITEMRGCYVARCGGLMVVCDATTHKLIGLAIVNVAQDGDCDVQGLQVAGQED